MICRRYATLRGGAFSPQQSKTGIVGGPQLRRIFFLLFLLIEQRDEWGAWRFKSIVGLLNLSARITDPVVKSLLTRPVVIAMAGAAIVALGIGLLLWRSHLK